MRRTPNPGLDAQLAQLGFDDTPYSGPTAFVTALLHALDEAGVPAASLWAASPPYLGAPNPAVSLGLLEAAERALDISLDLGRLQGISTDFLRKVEAALGAFEENVDTAELALPSLIVKSSFFVGNGLSLDDWNVTVRSAACQSACVAPPEGAVSDRTPAFVS